MNKKILLIGYSYLFKIIANQSNNIKCIEFVGIQDNNPSALKEFTKQFPKKKYSELSSYFDDYIEYIKKNNRENGPALVGLEIKNPKDLDLLKKNLFESGFQFEYLNENNNLLQFLI